MPDTISILVVDLDPLTTRRVTEAMEDYGPIVTSFSSIDLMNNALSQNVRVDVIIINLERPFEKFFGLLPHLKALLAHIEVVFVSRFDEESLWIEAIQRGAYDFLPKPIDPVELKRIVLQAVEKHRLVMTKKRPPANSVRIAKAADASYPATA
jgi:DNA-binding NtrC family response regulator